MGLPRRVGLLATFILPACLACTLDVAEPRGTPDRPGGGPSTGGPGVGEKPDRVFWWHNRIFGQESPFRTPIPPTALVDPDSEGYVALLTEAGEMALHVRDRSATLFVAESTTTFRGPVDLDCAPAWGLDVSVLDKVGIPEFAEPASVKEGSPPSEECGEAPGRQRHMVVIDGPSRCVYDFWQPRKEALFWSAGWVTAAPLDSDGFHAGGLGVRGSGAALLAGMIWPSELDDGSIRHKLAFSYRFVRTGGPVPPATNSNGTSQDPWALPMGAVLQLDPGLDLDTLGLDYEELVIARALQEFGMILVDSRDEPGIGLYAVDPLSVEGEPYSNTLPDFDVVPLSGIPVERFRVLALPEQDAEWEAGLSLPDNRCAAFR